MTDRDCPIRAGVSGWDAFIAWIQPTKRTERWSLYWYPGGEENEMTRAIDRQKAEYDEWQRQKFMDWLSNWLKDNGFDKETITFAELREANTEYSEIGWHDKYY